MPSTFLHLFCFYHDTFTICSKIPLDFVLSLCAPTSKHLNNLCRSIFENVEQIHEFQNTSRRKVDTTWNEPSPDSRLDETAGTIISPSLICDVDVARISNVFISSFKSGHNYIQERTRPPPREWRRDIHYFHSYRSLPPSIPRSISRFLSPYGKLER